MKSENNLEKFHSLSAELANANFGDARLSARVGMIADALLAQPAESFPDAVGDHASLEATYRLLRNPKVSFEKIMEPHFVATAGRISQQESVLVIHDTTTFEFSCDAERQGLGWVHHTKGNVTKGFFGHFALAVSANNTHLPLGIIGVETLVRTRPPAGKKGKEKRKKALDKESLRWGRLVEQVRGRLGPQRAIHIMDREADLYPLFAQIQASGDSFVVRLRHDRKITTGKEGETTPFLLTAVADNASVCEREVPLSRRVNKSEFASSLRKHPPREKRVAKLSFSASQVEIVRPIRVDKSLPESMKINVVCVRELNPPEGVEPIDWTLLTQEPIATAEQILKIVDYYRGRWMIEEYFKALKTGCSFEKRQLESLATLLNALAIFVPVAWRLLLLRGMARSHPTAPATIVLTEPQIAVLHAVAKRPLPQDLTVEQALLAIAALGGHIKNNGQPGWQVLGRGFRKLLNLEEGWTAAKNTSRNN